MREPKSLIFHEKIEKSAQISAQCLPDNCPMSANVCPMSTQSLPSVPYVCSMSHMSAQCPQILLNAVRGQISDFFRYVMFFSYLQLESCYCFLQSPNNKSSGAKLSIDN